MEKIIIKILIFFGGGGLTHRRARTIDSVECEDGGVCDVVSDEGPERRVRVVGLEELLVVGDDCEGVKAVA